MTDLTSEPARATRPDAATCFAAERNLLAWIRTGLALMGFGFVVARFGLFLREFAAVEGVEQPSTGMSMVVGTVLVLLGVAIHLFAAVGHWHTMRRLGRGEPLVFRPMSLGIIVAVLLAVLGAVMAAYLWLGTPGT